ncbi:hypothetical protein Ddye_003623 [Dipteronia dyeriana]|uniref:Diacylglycerol O-acyltransferase n=1 Tax=Dipteronia dyeriana TaxID=168575 RepID=A0AAE0CVM5_9ROSI|nr:hypothetical protein Ddye_003623 [Dipteronia dyeriana]
MVSDDEPLTPAGRLFLHPEMNTIIHCVIGLQQPLDVDQVKSVVGSSFMVQHPRFTSLMVRDRQGMEHWRKIQIEIDRHIILADHHPLTTAADDGTEGGVDSSSRAVSDYLAELSVSTPLSTDKPLWEVHVLTAHNCVILRIHHALGDGISLMSMFLATCRKAAETESIPSMGVGGGDRKKSSSRSVLGRNWREILLGFVKMVVFSLVFAVEFLLRIWVSDRKTPIIGGAGVELWPRKLAVASFRLEDMKAVKKAVAGATINDVLFGVVSSGLSRYLDHRSPNALRNGLRLTGLAMVNLREQPGLQVHFSLPPPCLWFVVLEIKYRNSICFVKMAMAFFGQELSDLMKSNSGSPWGNKFGMLLLPVYYHKSSGNPLDYLRRAKTMIDRKKQSLEGHLSYNIGNILMSCFGPKVAWILNYRIMCNTSFTISNVIGPHDEITIAGVPVTYLRANTSSLPHALTMHMVSYAGRADMQMLVAKDIIPDPEFLAKCFQDALLEMKEAAAAATLSTQNIEGN